MFRDGPYCCSLQTVRHSGVPKAGLPGPPTILRTGHGARGTCPIARLEPVGLRHSSSSTLRRSWPILRAKMGPAKATGRARYWVCHGPSCSLQATVCHSEIRGFGIDFEFGSFLASHGQFRGIPKVKMATDVNPSPLHCHSRDTLKPRGNRGACY